MSGNSEKGWKMALLFGVRGFAVYTDFPHRLMVIVGPWAIDLGPWSSTSRYSNGSHWHSGWHRWDEDPDW